MGFTMPRNVTVISGKVVILRLAIQKIGTASSITLVRSSRHSERRKSFKNVYAGARRKPDLHCSRDDGDGFCGKAVEIARSSAESWRRGKKPRVLRRRIIGRPLGAFSFE